MLSQNKGDNAAVSRAWHVGVPALLAATIFGATVAEAAKRGGADAGASDAFDIAAVREIMSFELEREGDVRRIEIASSGPVIWTSFRDSSGNLVLELPNAAPSDAIASRTLSDRLVRSAVITVAAAGERPLSRLVIDTAAPVEHAVVPRGERLIVELDPVGAAFESAYPVGTPVSTATVASTGLGSAHVRTAALFQGAGTPDDPDFGETPEGVPATQLQGVDVTTGEGSTVIWIAGDGAFYYSTFPLSEPYRFVVDLIGVVNTSPVSSIAVQGQVVDGVRVAQYKPQPELVSRVVIDLVDPVAPEVEATPDGLKLTFAVAPAAVTLAEAGAELEDSSEAEALEQAVEEVVEDAAEVSETYEVEPVAEAIDIEPAYTYDPPAPPQPAAADEVDEPAPSYEAYEHDQPDEPVEVARVEPVYNEPMQPEPAEAAPVEEYSVDAGEAAMAETPPSASLFDVSVDLSQEPTEPESAFEARDVTISGVTEYYGEPMTLTLRDADIKDVLRSFAQISGLNVIVQPGVTGTVTVEFTDVPWDQALNQILRINGLDYELEGNIMRIAPIAVLSQEAAERARLEAAKALAIPLKTILRRVSYATAGDIAGILGGGVGSSILSERGSVIVDNRTNTLIIKELPSQIDTVVAVIENLDIPEPQVTIEARIIETTKRFSRTLGINWGFSGISSAERGNTTGLVFPNNGTADGGVQLLTGGRSGFLDITLGNVLNTFNLDVILQAAETEGLINILSAPRITTLNNEQASIQSGLQIPVQTIANNTVSVQFVNATLRLDVTPHVTAEGTVLMDIDIQKREPQLAFAVVGATNAPIATKDAKTRVIVRDGGTTVIGGLYEVTSDQGEDRVPGLANVPILKHLFKNKRRNDENEELLIFITPRVVKL